MSRKFKKTTQTTVYAIINGQRELGCSIADIHTVSSVFASKVDYRFSGLQIKRNYMNSMEQWLMS